MTLESDEDNSPEVNAVFEAIAASTATADEKKRMQELLDRALLVTGEAIGTIIRRVCCLPCRVTLKAAVEEAQEARPEEPS